MNRTVAGILFVIASLAGGPVVYLLATMIVVNVVRGLATWLSEYFDVDGNGFVIHLIAVFIAGAIIYGVIWGLSWLASRTIGITRDYVPLNDTPEVRRAGRWLSVLLTLSIVFVLLTAFLTVWLRQIGEQGMFELLTSELSGGFVVLVFVSLLFMPATLATFIFGLAYRAIEPVHEDRVNALSAVSIVLPVVVLVAWLVLQWVNGQLF